MAKRPSKPAGADEVDGLPPSEFDDGFGPMPESGAEPAGEAPAPGGRAPRTEEEKALAKAGAPLEPKFHDDKPQPKFGTSRAAGPGNLPRVCHPLERAADGAKRFKVRSDNYGTGTRYVLAEDEESACECYAKAQKLDEQYARRVKQAGRDRADEVERPQFVVVELPD